MKKQLLTIAGVLTITCGAYAQGYVTMSSGVRWLWDEFTTPGVGIRPASAAVDYAIYWAPVSTVDPLTAVGTQFGTGSATALQQTATNGVVGMAPINLNTVLTGAGWTLGLNGATPAVGQSGGAGNLGYGQFQLAGTTAGGTYEMIIVGWNAAAGVGAILNGSYTAAGWSNPFNYLTGSSASDPNGTVGVGAAPYGNQFGIIPTVPEPGTLALAALGGASLLLFRRRK